jgi:hypothetical protein
MFGRFGARLRALVAAAMVAMLSTAAQAQEVQRGGTMVMIVQPEPATLASYLSVPATSVRWPVRSTKGCWATIGI